MSNVNNNLPIGMLLEKAGLISSEQLQKALNLQSQYTQMKLGEILVLQAKIKATTVDFFVNKWQEIKEEGRQFPIGYYLKNASLLNEGQIQTILTEQKKNKLKFGDIAVKNGWLQQNTLNFFLDNLSIKPPQLMSLIALEQYNQDTLHLERKYGNSSLILSRVIAWTGGNTTLTKTICHIFVNADFNIPAGLEADAVDKFVEGSIIKNWQATETGTYIKAVKENLVNNQRCNSISLLKEYRKILLSGSKEYKKTKEQKELLTLGLIVKEQNNLTVTNLIYKQIFNQDWTAEQIAKLQQKVNDKKVPTMGKYTKDNRPNRARSNETNTNTNINTNPQNTNTPNPLTKMSSLMIMLGILLLVPLVIAINNYNSLSKQEQKSTSVQESEATKLKQFCKNINLADSKSSLKFIDKLEQEKLDILNNFSKNLEKFPDNCETTLNKLRVLAAPQLGRENRVLEAIRHLCKIPADSEMVIEAEIWLSRWYNSPTWAQETKFYLEEISKYDYADCPAAHFLEYPEDKD